jgi:hypothetical protein
MPGRYRIDAAGALLHIMVRGIERIELFRGDTDSNYFAERLAEVLEDCRGKRVPSAQNLKT